MSAACSHCNDTGSLSKTLWGSLDCTHCGAAEERCALNAWISGERDINVDQIDAWVIYQVGKAAALEQAAKAADCEYLEFSEQAAKNNGRESDFAFGSVNSSQRIAAAIRSLKP